jgi:hypothetical protein
MDMVLRLSRLSLDRAMYIYFLGTMHMYLRMTFMSLTGSS